MKETQLRLEHEIAGMPVISVHEHHQEDVLFQHFTLEKLFLGSYVGWMNPFSADPATKGTIPDRRVFLEHVRYNSYFIWLMRGLLAIYDIDWLTHENWDEVSTVIEEAHRNTWTWHVEMMQSVGLYRRAIQDTFWEPGSNVGHPELFSPTFRINSLVICHHPEMADHNGNSVWQRYDIGSCSFDEYLERVEQIIAQQKAAGAVALKSALAYDRDIAFVPREHADAARAFGKHPSEVDPEDSRCFQDFIYDYICGLAAKYELPFQNHTGMALLHGSNPMKLERMIARHPRTKFILFHGGYPWVSEIAALAHNYFNVCPDLTWLPLISTSAAVRAIHEWLEVTPTWKTICWGGDCWCGEESVGAAIALKHVLATALAEKIDSGYLTYTEALEIARGFCYQNAEGVYGLAGVCEQL